MLRAVGEAEIDAGGVGSNNVANGMSCGVCCRERVRKLGCLRDRRFVVCFGNIVAGRSLDGRCDRCLPSSAAVDECRRMMLREKIRKKISVEIYAMGLASTC